MTLDMWNSSTASGPSYSGCLAAPVLAGCSGVDASPRITGTVYNGETLELMVEASVSAYGFSGGIAGANITVDPLYLDLPAGVTFAPTQRPGIPQRADANANSEWLLPTLGDRLAWPRGFVQTKAGGLPSRLAVVRGKASELLGPAQRLKKLGELSVDVHQRRSQPSGGLVGFRRPRISGEARPCPISATRLLRRLATADCFHAEMLSCALAPCESDFGRTTARRSFFFVPIMLRRISPVVGKSGHWQGDSSSRAVSRTVAPFYL